MMLIKTKKCLLLLTFLPLLNNTNIVFAGTSQIFSPSGLPRSNNQDYSIPDTTVSTQTFPTPPIPLRDMGMQNFSSVPLRHDINSNQAKPTSQENNGQSNAPLVSDSAKVETFFQIDSPTNINAAHAINKNASTGGSVGKLLWHTLDNIGVPMFIGKDNDLDPSLRTTNAFKTQSVSKKNNISPVNNAHQNIPDSQFEIHDLPLKDDVKLP